MKVRRGEGVNGRRGEIKNPCQWEGKDYLRRLFEGVKNIINSRLIRI